MTPFYKFFIELPDGQVLTWNCMSEHEAKSMYKRTKTFAAFKYKELGWGVWHEDE